VLFGCNGDGDSDPPVLPRAQVDGVTPLPRSETALVSAPVRAVFAQTMDAASVNESTFTLVDPLRNPIPADVSYDDQTLTAILEPKADLLPGTAYRATLSGSVRSAAGFPLATDFVWTFLTSPALAVVSTNRDGELSNSASSTFADSDREARLVAFESDAVDLVPDDTNELRDIFVKDTVTGLIVRANTSERGEQAVDGASAGAAISADGRYVAFESLATDLVDRGTNGLRHIFRKDLQTGAIRVVSRNRDDDLGNEASFGPTLSADGRYVAFASLATNLSDPVSNGLRQVYVKDMDTGVVQIISLNVDGDPAEVPADSVPAMSSDGQRVAFESLASNIVPGGTNGLRQVYVRDLTSGLVTLVSSDSDGLQATGGASNVPAISADGQFVAFESLATNLVSEGGNGLRQVYVKSLDSGLTVLASSSLDGDPGDEASSAATISGVGRFVAFASLASNLTSDATGAFRQILIKDLETGRVSVASSNNLGDPGNNISDFPSLSEDGAYVVFESLADNFAENDSNLFTEIFRSLNRLASPGELTP